MAFNRTQYKAAKLEQIKEDEKQAEKHQKRFGEKGFSFVGFHDKPEEGKNIYRVLPSVKGDGKVYVPYNVVWLPVMKDVYKDGEKTGEQELKKSQIFIATTHSDIVKKAGLQDPVEYYISQVYSQAEDIQDDKEKKKFLLPVEGSFMTKPVIPGLKPNPLWLCYALNEAGEIKKLRLNQGWFKQMQKVSFEESSENDEVSIDVFSDPDEGYPLVIDKGNEIDKKGNKRVKYTVSNLTVAKKESWEDFYEKHRVTDAQLEALSKMTSLEEAYIDSYTRRDLELAIEGLKNFEEENDQYDIIDTTEFKELCQKLYDILPEAKAAKSDDSDDKGSEPAKEEKKPVSKKEAKKETSEVEIPSPLKMKQFLRQYIADNYEGNVLPDLSKGDLIDWYVAAYKGEDLPIEEEEKEEKEMTRKEKEAFLEKYIKATSQGDHLPDLNDEQLEEWYKLALEEDELPFDKIMPEAVKEDKVEKSEPEKSSEEGTVEVSKEDIRSRMATRMSGRKK